MSTFTKRLEQQFYTELSTIHPQHKSRQAALAQSVLAFISAYHLTAPALSKKCKSLLIDNCKYDGGFWLETEKESTTLSLTTTL